MIKFMKIKLKNAVEEKGAALVAVLCFIATISLLVASSISISQIVNHLSAESSGRCLSAYLAEGAAARTVWLLVNDKKVNPQRELGEKKDEEEEDVERFLADGTKHEFEFNDTKVEVSIYDMTSGIDISGKVPSTNLKRNPDDFNDSEKSYDEYLAFIDCLDDYVDTDLFVRAHGAEKNEYLELELPPLPRNGQMQFREEALWIPGCTDFFKPDEKGIISDFQIIPLKGLPKVIGKKNFFTVSKSDIMKDCGYTEEVASQIISARSEWEKEKKPISEGIDEEILTKLKEKYSFKESGYYTIFVRILPGKGKSERIMTFSAKIDSRMPSKDIQYYDWRMY